MMACDSPDHHRHLGQELLVDCGYTRVIASRVGALGASFVRSAKPGHFTRANRDKPPRDANSYIPRSPPGKLREFTLLELGKATLNFSGKRLIGRGGFGEVFKGILSDGAMVAVKVRGNDSGQGRDEFQAEMRASCAIMGISHPNLVPAIGYHSSRKRKRKMAKVMIVYPFMVNGDVCHYLGDHRPSSLTPLDWPTRKRIALGVARGISSLHELGIVHRDIKPTNVLLDEDFNGHVGDLGLAKSMDLPLNSYNAVPFHGDEDSHHCDTTRVCGTMGYLAPESCINGHYSRKSDVFAFGVTLIQIVTGMPSVIEREEATRNQYIVDRAEQLFKNDEDLTRHMHPGISGMYDENEAIELIRLGLVCTQYDPEKRPLMPEVIAMMEGSSANLKQRWDNYDYSRSDRLLSADNQRETGAGGSERGDDEEVCCSYVVDVTKEELEENGDAGNQLQPTEDFASEELDKEYRASIVQHQHHWYRSEVSHCSSVLPGDDSSGVSGAESTSLTISRSQENDTLTEIVEVDLNEGGNSKQLSSQANRHEVATKLREVLDQMRKMELKHQAAMEEMHQKQIAMMQSMIKMQGQYIQKFNEMQSQIDQLKEA